MEEPTFSRMLDHVRETESTPPAWYSLAWSAHKVGLSVEAVRWLSVLFGGALGAVTLLFASRFLPLWAAVLAGTISALAWQLVNRGHELRAYALYALLSIVFALLLERAARRPGRGVLACLALTVAARASDALLLRPGARHGPPLALDLGHRPERPAPRDGGALCRHPARPPLAPRLRRPGRKPALLVGCELRPPEGRCRLLDLLLERRRALRARPTTSRSRRSKRCCESGSSLACWRGLSRSGSGLGRPGSARSSPPSRCSRPPSSGSSAPRSS